MAQVARSGVYFCRQASRCVAPVPGGDGGRHRFLIGTCALQQRNEIHLVEFSDQTAEIVCRQVLPHEDEVWLLSASPSDGRHILTYSSGKNTPALRLWRASDIDAPEATLQQVSTFADDDQAQLTTVKSALWDPHHEGNIVIADTEALHVFQGTVGGPRFNRLLFLQVGQRVNGACLDPHHPQQVSTVDDTHLKTWDLRTSRLAFKRDGVHLFGARDVDYNPNVPYQVMTTGEDATLRFWDLRQLAKCRKVLAGGHHHWITHARYNSHHDQLVLSCGTDSAVCLWRAGSVASTPLGAETSADNKDAAAASVDGLIRRYEEHDDSCYSCCWSAVDAWVFAAISYDGKLVVNRVPAEEKNKILLY